MDHVCFVFFWEPRFLVGFKGTLRLDASYFAPRHETMGSHCLLAFTGESTFQSFFGGAGFRPSPLSFWWKVNGDPWWTWFHNLPGKSIYFTPMLPGLDKKSSWKPNVLSRSGKTTFPLSPIHSGSDLDAVGPRTPGAIPRFPRFPRFFFFFFV